MEYRARLARAVERLAGDTSHTPAILLGSSVNGLSFARSLGRRGIPVLLLDSKRLYGSYSRYATFVALPDSEDEPDIWLDALLLVAARLPHKAVLFPTADPYVLLLSKHQEQLRPHFHFIVPGLETVEHVLNKRLQYTLAQSAGIPIPDTWFPETVSEVRDLAPMLPYPCILKPYQSYVGRRAVPGSKVWRINTASELVSAFERLSTASAPFLIQEIVPGPESNLYGYLSFWDADGDELAWASKRKLRQFPPNFGDGSLQVAVDAPEVVRLSRRLLSVFNYRGFASVEYKLDPRDGTYRLMEINPRTVSGNQLAIESGVDLPWLGYQYLLDRPLPSTGFRSGARLINEEWDIQAYFALRRTGQLTFGAWRRSFTGAHPAIAALDDPLPILMGLLRFLKLTVLRVGRPDRARVSRA